MSRQEYLKKREEAKLQELKDALEDEKFLFQGKKMTEKERRDLAYKEEVYRLAVERKKQLGEAGGCGIQGSSEDGRVWVAGRCHEGALLEPGLCMQGPSVYGV